MKIALFGASGMVGSRLTKEAADRGHEVTAITRSGGAVPHATQTLKGDMGDADFDRQVVADHDVIVSTTGPSRTGAPHADWLNAVETLARASGDKRVFFVGGAGSLLVGETQLKDTAGFPAAYKAESDTASIALDNLRAGNWSPWTLISPAPEIAPGQRTGNYSTALDVPAGDSISAEDFVVAMVDEIESPQHIDSRFTVAN